jgi:hypothetical protein
LKEEPMTGAEVTRALHEFEARLRGLGVPVVDRLRPGLAPERAQAVAAEFGVRLSPDALAWWSWHDGDRERYEDDWGVPGLTPFTVFCGLRSALERSAQARRVTWDADVDPDRPDLDWRFRPQWVTLLQAQAPLVMDCTDADRESSPTGVWSADGGIGRTISLSERVGWWLWALDHGYWRPRAGGGWDRDESRSPGRLVGPHARDHAE